MTDFETKYAELADYFNRRLNEYCENLSCTPSILSEGMKYSLLLGGKRLRPVLMLASGELLGVDKEVLFPYALALELIHTYSLIHDDLPEMDDDDYRRGKPSNHKVFGCGNAVLAGDGLLNTAYEILFGQCLSGAESVYAARYICECAGIKGMIAGQSMDLLHERDETPEEATLDFIYEHKTAKLLEAALVAPSILCGGKYYAELKLLGQKLGYLFQLTDDLLDVSGSFENLGKSVGKDEREQKLTAVRLYGVNDCKLRAEFVSDDCHKIIDGFDGDCSFLHALVNKITTRIS